MIKKTTLWFILCLISFVAMGQNFRTEGGIGDFRRSATDAFLSDIYSIQSDELIVGSDGGIYDYTNDNGKFLFFKKIFSIPDTQRIIKLQPADLNSDTYTDIVFMQENGDGTNRLGWLEGLKDGGFGTVHTIAYLSDDHKTFYVQWINADSYPDVLILGGKDLILALNNGDATFDTIMSVYSSYETLGLDIYAKYGAYCNSDIFFSTAANIKFYCYNDTLVGPVDLGPNVSMAGHLAFADYNNDREEDFIATDDRGKVIFYKAEDYFFEDTVIMDSLLLEEARGAFAVDWDGDDDPDVLISRYTYSNLFWLENIGYHDFQGPYELKSANFPALSFTQRLLTYDVDRDGDKDIINTSYETLESPALAVAYNENNNFDKTQILIPDKRFTHIEFCDINNDGLQDMFVVPKTYDFPGFWFRNSSEWNNIIKLPYKFVRLSYATLTDIDNDGDLDIVAIRDSLINDITDIVVLENIAFDYNYWTEHNIGRFHGLKKLHVTKDSNGLPNIIAYKNDTLWFLSNNGNFTFTQSVVYTTNDTIAAVDTGDFNNDAKTDIILADGFDIKILYNNGTNYNPAVKADSSHSSYKFSALKSGDWNKDGLTDFVAAEMSPHFALNQGNGDFDIDVKWYVNIYQPSNIVLADLDKNGYPDFISAGYKNQIYYALNDSNEFFSYDIETPGKPWKVYAFDYDYDKDMDLMYITQDKDSIIFIRNRILHFIQQPKDTSVCEGASAKIGLIAEADQYKWFYALNNKNDFTPVPENEYFNGTTSDTLIIKHVENWLNQSQYYCQIILEDDTLLSDTILLTMIEDTTAPELRTVSGYSVYLDQNGQGSLSANNLILYANDNCVLKDTAIAPTQFNCDNLGFNDVSITVTDWAGNQTTEYVQVEVVDTISPEITCPENTTVTTSSNFYTISGYEFDPVVTDNCNIFDLYAQINDTGFFALTLNGVNLPAGQNKIQWFVTDDSYNGASCSFYVTVQSLTMIEDKTAEIKIFPNPATDQIIIQLPEPAAGKITLFDLAGKPILSKKITSDKMPMSLRGLPSGIYYLQIETADRFLTKKIIKK